MVKISQVRYEKGSPDNIPKIESKLWNGSAFNNYFPITYLKITTNKNLPIYINGNSNPAYALNGVFEVNVDGIGEIISLKIGNKNSPMEENEFIVVDMIG